MKNDRETSYKVYIAVQNELVAAYNDLRDREFASLNPYWHCLIWKRISAILILRYVSDRERLKPLLDEVKAMYPQKLSEAEPSKNN